MNTMDQPYKHIRIEQQGLVLRVTLNHPEVRNAFTPLMIAELTAVFSHLEAGGEVRAVVLSGAGESFCAGADLTWMGAMAAYTREENVADAVHLAKMLEAVEGCEVPVVARVHGAALGGGAGLVAACDVVVSSSDTLFGFTEARLGIAPTVIAPFVLRKIGPGHARALFVTGERFNAARAERIGLVHRLADRAGLDVAINVALESILSCGPAAVRACKELVAEVPGLSREAARAYTAETIATLRASPEGQEGMRAFLERRSASFVEALPDGAPLV